MPNRRKVILGIGGTIALAGCAGDTEEQESTPTDTPTPTETPSPPSFEVIEISVPDSVDLHESFQIKIQVENTGGQEGTWNGELFSAATYGVEPDEWNKSDIELTIPSGGVETWYSR